MSETRLHLVADTDLSIPRIAGLLDIAEAALAYAECGFYVGPLLLTGDHKHAGSVLGKDWPAKTSRNPEVIRAWFAGHSDRGLFLHLGRSGAVSFDVDAPDHIPAALAKAIEETDAPHQSSRPETPGRGHYLFAVPAGMKFGNGLGKLGRGWGEVRGQNGIIVVVPTPHGAGGRYEWIRFGALPVLPAYVADLLPDRTRGDAGRSAGFRSGGTLSGNAATDAEVIEFLGAHQGEARPTLLEKPLDRFVDAVTPDLLGRRESSHVSACDPAAQIARESAAGYYSSERAFGALEDAFEASFPSSTGRLHPAGGEFAGIVAWAVGQATPEAVEATRSRIDEKLEFPEYDPFEGDEPSDELAVRSARTGEWRKRKCSELGNGYRLLDHYGGIMRYLTDGRVWATYQTACGHGRQGAVSPTC